MNTEQFTGHTPGKWVDNLNFDDTGSILFPNGWHAFIEFDYRPDLMDAGEDAKPEEEEEEAPIDKGATLALMAAAPALLAQRDALLAACKVALDYLEANRPGGDIRKNFTKMNQHENGTVKPLRAAIALCGEGGST